MNAAKAVVDDKTPFLDDVSDTSEIFQEARPASRCWICLPLPWILSSTLLLALNAILIFQVVSMNRFGSFERGYVTDLAAVRNQLRTFKYRFTGGPTFAPDGTESLRLPIDSPRYIGTPSDEMDAAWERLTSYRYFLLTEEEARDAWGTEYTQFWNEQVGGYQAAFDYLHLLHCLDHIRQSFYPERYPHQGIHGELHKDHCIDALRQMLLCNADTTPIPSRWYPGIGQNYIDSDRVHICRDEKAIRKWQLDRVNGSSAVPPTQRGYP